MSLLLQIFLPAHFPPHYYVQRTKMKLMSKNILIIAYCLHCVNTVLFCIRLQYSTESFSTFVALITWTVNLLFDTNMFLSDLWREHLIQPSMTVATPLHKDMQTANKTVLKSIGNTCIFLRLSTQQQTGINSR